MAAISPLVPRVRSITKERLDVHAQFHVEASTVLSLALQGDMTQPRS